MGSWIRGSLLEHFAPTEGGFVYDGSKITALAVVSIPLSDNMVDFMDDVNINGILMRCNRGEYL